MIILLVATCFEKFRRNRIVKGCMSGLKPAVIGMIGAALLSVAGTVFVSQGFSTALFSDPLTYVSLGIFLLAAVLAFKKKHPIFIICLAAILGVATGYLFA